MPANQKVRNQVAKMKQIPIPELIEGKKLLFVDDSIVRGTQLRETVEFLYRSHAAEVHMRSACPPIMYSCKYLNFSSNGSDMDLLARRVVQELEGDEGHKHLDEYADASTERGKCMLLSICEKLGFDSLGYQSRMVCWMPSALTVTKSAPIAGTAKADISYCRRKSPAAVFFCFFPIPCYFLSTLLP